jgi:hypothetical protein
MAKIWSNYKFFLPRAGYLLWNFFLPQVKDSKEIGEFFPYRNRRCRDLTICKFYHYFPWRIEARNWGAVDERFKGLADVKSLHHFTEIFLYQLPVDMRKQINGLATIVEQEMGESPFCGALYIFLNGSGSIIKFLYWDKTGFATWGKRLEKERFPRPRVNQGALKLNSKYLELLLDGHDIFKLKAHTELSYKKIC